MNPVPGELFVVLLAAVAGVGIGCVVGYQAVIRWAQRPENPDFSWEAHAKDLQRLLDVRAEQHASARRKFDKDLRELSTRYNRRGKQLMELTMRSKDLEYIERKVAEIAGSYEPRAYAKHVPKQVRDLFDQIGGGS